MDELVKVVRLSFKPLPSAKDRNEFLIIVLARMWVMICLVVIVGILALAVKATA